MNSPIKLSIITVTYNSEKYIKDTLESVLNQRYDNYEYIIVDGGSTDGTISILNDYIDRFNGKMSFTSEPDKGIYDAMNNGILRATGDYVGIINSDDRYTPDAFNNVISTVIESSERPDVVFSDMLRIDEKGNKCGVILGDSKWLKKGMLVNHPTCFVQKRTYDKYGVFDLQYKIVADYDLMLRILHGGGNFKKCATILSEYRDGGVSFNNYSSVLEKYSIQRKYYDFLFCLYIRMRGYYRCKLKEKMKYIIKNLGRFIYKMPDEIVNIGNRLQFIYYGIRCGSRFKSKGLLQISTNKHPGINSGKGITIGDGVSIVSSFKANPASHAYKSVLYTIGAGHIVIGNNVGISNSIIAAADSIVLEDNVMIGAGCKIYDNDWHPVNYSDRIVGGGVPLSAPVCIKNGAWLCEGVTVLKGVTISERAVIAAGSIVTKDVPADEVWGGNPAKLIKSLK